MFFILLSIIKEAIFYPSGIALIIEEREVNLKKGYNIVELKFLPVIDENSFAIEFDKGEIISTSAERKSYLKLKDKFKILQDSFDFYKRKIDSLNLTKENLKKAKEFLESFKVSYSEKESKEFLLKKFESENIKKALDLIIKEGTEIELKTNLIEEEIKELIFKKNRIMREINWLAPIGKEEIILKIHLNSQIEDKGVLKIKYILLNKTGFNMVYRIKGEPEKEKVIVEEFAKAFQITGDDFENIKLTLSTYQIKRDIKPFIGEWRIEAFKPFQEKKKLLSEVEEEVEQEVQMLRVAPEEPKKLEVKTKELYTSFYYEFPYKISLPSSREGRNFYIKTFEFPAKFEYEVFPRAGEKAFLKAKTHIKLNEPLLEGELNIFLNNEYIGKDYIEGFNPGDTVTFFFGEDPFLKVENKLIKSEIKKKKREAAERKRRKKLLMQKKKEQLSFGK